ncbi:unnamed protein product, partial [Didymodactylos carnosus]
KFRDDCRVALQLAETIQTQLLLFSDTYGDKELLETKKKKLNDLKNKYRDLTVHSNQLEQTYHQIQTIVDNHEHSTLQNQWKIIQEKTHQLNSSILK